MFWHLVVDLTAILQESTRLRADCQAHGVGPDFSQIAPLRDRVTELLDKWGGKDLLLDFNPCQGETETHEAFRQRTDWSLKRAFITFCILSKRMMLVSGVKDCYFNFSRTFV